MKVKNRKKVKKRRKMGEKRSKSRVSNYHCLEANEWINETNGLASADDTEEKKLE